MPCSTTNRNGTQAEEAHSGETGKALPDLGRWRRLLNSYPHVPQRDETDCGAACLAMITAFYGRRVGLARLRDMANVDAGGATMWSVSQAAEALGFHARGLRLEFESLKDVHLPAVIHWEGSHYVVLYEVGRRHVVIGDPDLGRRRLTIDEFLAGWTRVLLELIPTDRLTDTEQATSPARRFFPIFLKFKGMILEVLAASLLLSAIGLATPLFTQTVVDRVLAHRSVDLLNMLLIGMLVLVCFKALMGAVRQLLLVNITSRFDARLIADFFRHVFRLPMRFFELRRVGDIVSRVSENRKIREAMAGTIPGIMLDTVLATSYFGLLAFYNTRLTLLVLAVVPVFALLMLVFTPPLRRNEKEQFAKQTEASTFLIETMTGISTVKAMAVEPQVRWKLESLFLDAILVGRRGDHIAAAYSSFATLLQSASSVLFLWYGAHEVLDGNLSVGQLLAFLVISNSMIEPVLRMVQSWQELQQVRNAVDRLNDVFEVEPEQSADRALLRPARLGGEIELEGVSFSYVRDEQELVLDEIDLKISAEEVVAVVGRSGSGKSTLAKLILGLHQPSSGRVSVDGNDLRSLALPAYRRRLGVVPQEVFLFSGTVRDNIALGNPEAPFDQIVAAARLAGAHEFIRDMGLGYDTPVGERGMSLSGGQRQRIGLARALLTDPDILVLDEATSALDAVSERAIQENLETICRGRTTIIIAHRLSTIRKADRILVMDGGRIVEQGSHRELLSRGGLYRTLVGEQLDR